MADVAITDARLRETITERLGAVHVEVTDMSGEFKTLPLLPCRPFLFRLLTGDA